MVLQITLDRDLSLEDAKTDVYTVHVESHRILTVVTHSDTIVTNWLKHALKSSSAAKATVLVGVASEAACIRWCPPSKDKDQAQYDILCLNIGSHSLIYELPDYPYYKPHRFLSAFFKDPRVVAVGRDMANLSRRLRANNGIEIGNAVDVNDLAVKGFGRDDLDLGRYDLDRLAMAVLGRQMDVDRSVGTLRNWYPWDDLDGSRMCQKIKFFWAVDPYLSFLIGLELIDAIDGAAAGLKKKKKNNNNNKK